MYNVIHSKEASPLLKPFLVSWVLPTGNHSSRLDYQYWGCTVPKLDDRLGQLFSTITRWPNNWCHYYWSMRRLRYTVVILVQCLFEPRASSLGQCCGLHLTPITQWKQKSKLSSTFNVITVPSNIRQNSYIKQGDINLLLFFSSKQCPKPNPLEWGLDSIPTGPYRLDLNATFS
jgi:hypothetical protein